MPDIVELQLGDNLIEAQIITQRIQAHGFQVELVEYLDEVEVSIMPLNKLLVRRDDVEAVNELLREAEQQGE